MLVLRRCVTSTIARCWSGWVCRWPGCRAVGPGDAFAPVAWGPARAGPAQPGAKAYLIRMKKGIAIHRCRFNEDLQMPYGGVTDKRYKLILMKGVRGFYIKWRGHDENTGKL